MLMASENSSQAFVRSTVTTALRQGYDVCTEYFFSIISDLVGHRIGEKGKEGLM